MITWTKTVLDLYNKLEVLDKVQARSIFLQVLRSIRCPYCIKMKKSVKASGFPHQPSDVKEIDLDLTCSGVHFRETENWRSFLYVDLDEIKECKLQGNSLSIRIMKNNKPSTIVVEEATEDVGAILRAVEFHKTKRIQEEDATESTYASDAAVFVSSELQELDSCGEQSENNEGKLKYRNPN